MRPINDPYSRSLSVLLNIIGIVSLSCITCSTSLDDSKLENLRLLKSINGVEEVLGTADFDPQFDNPQSNITALEVLRQSAEFKKLFHVDGLMIYSNVSKNDEKDNVFAFLLPVMNSEEELTVVFTPCGSLPVTWKLLYRPPNVRPENNFFSPVGGDETIGKFSGDNATIFHRPNAQGGLYLVEVKSEEDTFVQIHASTVRGGQGVVNISSFKIDSQIKVEQKFDMNPPTARLRLPELNIEMEQFFLVFVISRKKFYQSLCNVRSSHPERSKYIDEDVACRNLQNDTELQVCRTDGHRTLVDLQLEPKHTYYISVFAWESSGLSVQYSRVNFTFPVHASTVEGSEGVGNISRFKIDTQIKVEQKFDMNPPTARLRLPELNIELEQFFLVFVISRKKFYQSLDDVRSSHPERSKYIDEDVACRNLQNDTELQVCRTDGHRTLVDLQLEPKHKYYISVFAWESSGLSVQYSRVNFTFKQFPKRLRDGVPQTINITTNGGKFSFKYKIRKNNTGIDSKLLFYVLPCLGMGSIRVEVKQNKNVVLRKQINEYEKFEIANPQADRRYIIVIRSKVPKTVRGCDLFEVMATVRPNAFPLPPAYPNDTRINVTMPTACAAITRTKHIPIANVTWFPIVTNEVLKYCVYVKSIPANETGSVFISTSVIYLRLKESYRKHVCVELFNWNKSQPFSIKVRKLRPRVNYAIQVIVKKPYQYNRFLSYKILNDVHSKC